MNQIYLLRIMDGSRVIAEAPLIIHDQEMAWKQFEMAYPDVLAAVPGSVFKAMMWACHDELLKQVPAQGLSAIMIAKQSPLQIQRFIPPNGGQSRDGRT